MEIKAKGKFDIDTAKAIMHLALFKKADPKKRMIFWTVMYALLSLIIVTEVIVFEMDSILFIPLGVGILWLLFMYFLYFIVPKIMCNALGNMKDVENEYVFCDNALKALTQTGECTDPSEIEYSLFARVYETSKYFFLYNAKHQALIIDKSTIEGGTAEDIRNKLSAFVKDKYVICKY